MTPTTSNPPPPSARRRVSVRWLGWALTCATLGAVGVGVVVVDRLGRNETPPPPIEIATPPPADDEPEFHVLQQDEPPLGAAWPEPSLPSPAVRTATRPDNATKR